MTMPVDPKQLHTGNRTTRAARPRERNPRAPLREKLTRSGHMPYEIPQEVLGVLAVLQQSAEQLAGTIEKLQRNSPILRHGIVQLDGSGLAHLHSQIGFTCVSVANLTAATVTIAPAGNADPTRPPTVGAGVHQVPAGAAGTFGVIGNSLAVYGPAAGLVDVGLATEWLPGF